MRLPPTRAASTSSRRCIVLAPSGPLAGSTSACWAAAQKARPQPNAAAPRTLLIPITGMAGSARAGAAQVGRRVVAGRALQGLVDRRFLVAQPHGDVAARLQVVVHLDRREHRRDVVPVLAVLLREAPQL